MSGWYQTLVTTTSSKISTLRSTLTNSEADGDTEDDTHVCRVLRAYYTEKGRPFPGWLPPDPKAPPPVAPVYAQPQVGSRYGAMGGAAPGPGGGGGGLSSLWDKNAPKQPVDQQSLRQGRGVPPPARGGGLNPYGRGAPADTQTRPQAGQRSGSYQQSYGGGREASPPVGGGAGAAGGSAGDKMRNRFFGGARTTSPAGQSQFQPPAQPSGGGGGYGGSRGGGSDNYEDRFAPGGMYDAGGRSGGADKPYLSANAPWSNNENEFMGGGGGGGSGGGGRGPGLPSGPRRTGGLPSGPRMR